GKMGQALAGTFLAAGHPTTVWNRTAGKADGLVAEGAVSAATVAEAVAGSELVVICVATYANVTELLAPLGGELSGKVLVNLTTGTPEDARTTSSWASGHGIAYPS
ncbi:NAD(P)-binding domain-containing protein, partial [Streptomyces sp. NPDC059164]|uniref:NAD(P)-binding domain-containing protein n=1 Tax=Streptomyces sp. NPDC059164 TaxID=3346750 RepID=UPI003697409C